MPRSRIDASELDASEPDVLGPEMPLATMDLTGGVPAAADVAPLPRGRHSLSREEVATAQKLRLAVATAEAMAERGYAATPVADILARAKVSRQSFYEHYRDKQECFLDALDLVGAALVSELRGATVRPSAARSFDARSSEPGVAAERTTRDRVALATAAIDRYLAAVVAQPTFARLYVVEVHAAGPEALARRAALQERLVDDLARLLGATTDQARFACRAFVAAVSALIAVPLAEGDIEALQGLRDPLRQLLRDLASTF